jgi:hypothetical protein
MPAIAVTQPAQQPEEYVLSIAWSRFGLSGWG